MSGPALHRAVLHLLAGTSLVFAGSPVVAGKDGAALGVRPVDVASQARAGSPNVVVVLMDDVGFAADSTFGGPVPTPNLDALAAQGLRYNRFHTTGLCSPTRASLLTGRNHHRVEIGAVVNLAVGEPGYTGQIPDSAATIGDVMRTNGYATAWFGKNHLTPGWEQTAAGPFDHWPTGLGFDYFYGFMDGGSDQFNPILVENRNVIEPSQGAGYILDRDLADHAINWIDRINEASADKPFLIYLATGSAHEPHQAPAEWMARFRGKFDRGYDEERKRIFERQKAIGIIPANAKLTPRPDLLPAWDSLSPEQRHISARLMEAFAAQRAYFDYQFGRIVEHIKASGEWDNTLVLFIDGDNGSSGEGGFDGTLLGQINRPAESLDYQIANEDKIGGPLYAGNYSAAWGWALDAPFPWFKQIPSYLGGTRAGMVVSWPARIKARGEVRSQYGHINDIAPTIYEAAGIKPPETFAGVKQLPIDGVSLAYSFSDGAAPSRHRIQYYEMVGNVGIYKDGWLANLGPPNVMFAPGYGRNKHWELYDLDQDYSQSRNLAAEYPAKLSELKREWQRQQKLNGFKWLNAPIAARRNPALRPDPFAGARTLTYRRGEGPFLDGAFPSINNRSWSLRVPVTLASDRESGTIISQGGYPYGWGLYFIKGKPTFLYVNEPEPAVRVETREALGPGKYMIELSVSAQSARPGGPATVSLRVDDGEPVTVKLEKTVPAHWGANGIGIGSEVGKPMLPGMAKPFTFSGQMGEIALKLEE